MHSRWPARIAATLFALGFTCASGAASIDSGLTLSVRGRGAFTEATVEKVIVAEVSKGSPAEACGIVAGDEIIEIQGHPVPGRPAKELQSFVQLLAELPLGSAVTVRIKRVGGAEVVTSIIASR